MSAPSFVHLHNHSFYSLLDGLARPSDIAATAAALGQKAIALTDHGAMYGIVEFSRACIEKGVKPIIGTEAYITEFGRPMGGRDKMKDRANYHMLLLAENEIGYKNLIKLSSLAQTEGFYHKPRIDHDLLAKYSEGIIATSGCMAAEIPSLLNDEHHTPDEIEAERRLNWYLDVFGRDRFFIEFQEHSIAPLQKLNYKLRTLANRNHVRMIATNDSHYARSTDTLAHDMILCINMQTTLNDTNRMSMATGEYYIKSLDEMKSALSYLELPDDAFYSTGEIADRCDVNVEYPNFAFPDIKIPDGYTYDTYLEELTWKGAEARYGDRLQYDDVLTNRIKHELNIIKGMKFSVYYLIVGDICAYAQRMGIWWNVRGSGAGSVVAYCTGITRVDPLKYGLIFERFLNPSRHGMPDFDLDFPDDSRESLIAYTMHKYGERSVAQIVSFSTIKSRGAIKDVGRLLGQDPSYMNTLSEMVPFGSSTLEDALKESPELTLNYQSDSNVKNIVDLGMTIEGVKRNMSIHPAAVIITPGDVMNYVPLVKPPASAVTPYVTQFEYPICESLGLLKIDFLGLRTLTIMRIACDLIFKRYGIKYSLDTIPIDGEEADPAFKLLQTGYTLGVFQVESSGMQETLRSMQPTTVENITAVVSLYRPGPMDYIPTFIKRMHGEEMVEYRHPKMELALGETFGLMIYQENVMQIATDLAGYTGAEADNMRRAIGKKKEKDLKKHHEMFVEGCITHSGIDRQVAEDIYSDILKFANYGFNKCLTADTLIYDPYLGRQVPISEMLQYQKYSGSVLSMDDNLKLVPSNIKTIHRNGVKPVYRLKTRTGKTIRATMNHPLYTYEGWKDLGDLVVGDMIATPRKMVSYTQNNWSDHQLITLGYLLAEGNLCHPSSVTMYTAGNEQCDDFAENVQRFENTDVHIGIHKSTYAINSKRVIRNEPQGLYDWINSLGLIGVTATHKFIPEEVFTLSDDNISMLLGRMWSGDGHMYKINTGGYYATSSELMAKQIHHLLTRLGVISSLQKKVFKYQDGEKIGYIIVFTGSSNLLRFANTIGKYITDTTKLSVMNEWVRKIREEAYGKVSNMDVVPVQVRDDVRLAQQASGIPWLTVEKTHDVSIKSFNTQYLREKTHRNGFSREIISKFADAFQSKNLHKHADSDIYWDIIDSIEYIGEEETYDLEIEGVHNFVANDIIVHNSHGLDYAVLSVQTAWLKAVYPIEFMAATLSAVKEDITEVSKFVAESKRMGIDVVTPDVNYSEEQFAINDNSEIVFALSSIKHLKDSTIREIVEERKNKPFRSLEDFCERISLKTASIRGVEVLITSGALDRLRPDDKDVIEWRALLLSSAQDILEYSGSIHRHVKSNQMSWFGEKNGLSLNLTYPPSIDEEFLWKLEGEVLGLMISHNPVEAYYPLFNRGFTPISLLGEIHAGAKIKTLGLIREVKSIVTKKGDMMGFITLDDNANSIAVTIFPKAYGKYVSILKNGNVVLLAGKLDFSKGNVGVIADFIEIAPSLQQ